MIETESPLTRFGIMNLPRKWNVLNLNSDKKYYYGVDFAIESWHYSLYVTDFSNVWICDVDEERLHIKALQNGIEQDSIGSVYQTLITSFENNFSGEDTETKIHMDELKVDKGVPLELKLNMVKSYSNAKLNWNFDLVILPDSSAITILKNLIFHLSTVIFSLNEYKDDLVRLIEHKDSAIRFLGETVEGMNGGNIISKWAPQNSANARVIRSFEKNRFDHLWKEKRMPQIEDQYIWDILQANTLNSSWTYGTSFQDQKTNNNPPEKEERKPINNTLGGGADEDDFEELASHSDDFEEEHQRGMDSLSIDEENTKSPGRNSPKKESDTDTGSSSENSKNTSKQASASNTPSPTKQENPSKEASSPSKSPSSSKESMKEETQTKPKRHFGAMSRKRKVHHSGFSPIKAQKQFHSKD